MHEHQQYPAHYRADSGCHSYCVSSIYQKQQAVAMCETKVRDFLLCIVCSGSFIGDQIAFHLPSFTIRLFNPCLDILSLIYSINVIFLNQFCVESSIGIKRFCVFACNCISFALLRQLGSQAEGSLLYTLVAIECDR